MNKEPKILLIEDNEGDVELITEAFKEYKINLDINVVSNGEEAINYLNLKARHGMEHRPDLILLDINLPKVDGKEVLHFIKTDDILKTIPVVMLTSSSLEKDIYYAYSNQANCYIVKPANLDKFIDVIHHIESFWLDYVTYPNLN
jgi:chemotaxis family two-component system response regulator Rcp1